MELKVYNGEKFEKSKMRYVRFAMVLIAIIALSIRKDNLIGVIVLFFIVGAYLYYNILSNYPIKIKLEDKHIVINNKAYLRGSFNAYCIEVDKQTGEIKNLVLLSPRGHQIYTIDDDLDKIEEFLIKLDEHLPIVDKYNQTFLEKLSRILKL